MQMCVCVKQAWKMIQNGQLVKTLTEMVTSFFQAVAQENREETQLGHLLPRLRVGHTTFQTQIYIYIWFELVFESLAHEVDMHARSFFFFIY